MSTKVEIPVILVVDDNPQNLQLIGGMLGESKGFDLSFATGGSEALEIMESLIPDLVLLDINMPGMNGFEVCRRIRGSELTAQIPVIFLTAQGETDYIVQGFQVGGNDYLVKPCKAEELLARVRVQLELHWSRIEMKRLNRELQRVNEELRLLSNTDGLLHIANRRHFDDQLAMEWQRAIRSGQPLALLMIDVDHFKWYNDYYGHLQGDECLRQVSAAVRSSLRRPSDLLARYGGEELAVILPETARESAVAVAGFIHRALQAAQVRHEASPVAEYVTVSIGVAGTTPALGELPAILIEAADRALYAAKESGRNRTCLDGQQHGDLIGKETL